MRNGAQQGGWLGPRWSPSLTRPLGAGRSQDFAIKTVIKAEGGVEFPIGKQPGVRSHHRPAKLEQQAVVEIDPESPIVRFTRRVRHQGALHA